MFFSSRQLFNYPFPGHFPLNNNSLTCESRCPCPLTPFLFHKTTLTTTYTMCNITNPHTELAQLFIVSYPNMAQNPLIIPRHSVTQGRHQIQTTTIPPHFHDIPNHCHGLNSSVPRLSHPQRSFPFSPNKKKRMFGETHPFFVSPCPPHTHTSRGLTSPYPLTSPDWP